MHKQVAALVCSLWSAFAQAEMVDIDNAELARLLSQNVPIIDIRTAPEWQETGIVPGSHLITFFDDRGRADPASWLERAKTVGKPGDPVILICRTGNRTRLVGQFLAQQAGYAKVFNVKAGIKAWLAEQRPVTSGAQAIAACKGARTC